MSKKLLIITFLFTFLFGTAANAHSGRTDSSGGHNCSEKSKAKGLCSGYHYHNSGSSTSGASAGGGSTAINNDKDCTDFATYDEMIAYWNKKGYSATYDPENLDGWGNGQVDDGIPCEAPIGYDLTKINNSPQQNQYKKEQQDNSTGEKQGYSQGLKDGYQEITNKSTASTGSEAFKQGYAFGYNKGYDEGKKKIESEKVKATNHGYALGKKQDKIVIPPSYKSHVGLKKSFEDGFIKAVTERVEEKKKQFKELGYSDGKNDVNSSPKDAEAMYVEAYQEGYDMGQNELKKSYLKQGYEAAFTMLKYQDPKLKNDKLTNWYKEGFESNKEINQIKKVAFQLGKEGGELIIPSKYKKGEPIFKHYYQLGYNEYEENQNKLKATGGVGAAALAIAGGIWYGNRKKRNAKKERFK